jgi:hypothetical protein
MPLQRFEANVFALQQEVAGFHDLHGAAVHLPLQGPLRPDDFRR